MRLTALVLALTLLPAARTWAQIRVNPEGVNVSGQSATTMFLTFAPLGGYRAADAMWCGELIPATPDVGVKCHPATIYGMLPERYERGRLSGIDAYTDIMSVPVSVARRAYEAAARGERAEFFYVRRFVAAAGGPDQYVRVTCRLTAGGARVPLSLVNVRLGFSVDAPVLQVKAGEPVAAFSAQLHYTGTGRLKGRWEVVLPGQDPPGETDLLTEATLPFEQRGTQRRYTEIERFNVFLPPTGRFTLAGPDPARLPTGASGQYLVLLRIEVGDDREAESNLAAIGAGSMIVHAGGVAGFPMPVLRYIVGSGGGQYSSGDPAAIDGAFIAEADDSLEGAMELRWSPSPGTHYYQIEITTAEHRIHLAYVRPSSLSYVLPPFVADKAAGAEIRWRVAAFDASGRLIGNSDWSAARARKHGQR